MKDLIEGVIDITALAALYPRPKTWFETSGFWNDANKVKHITTDVSYRQPVLGYDVIKAKAMGTEYNYLSKSKQILTSFELPYFPTMITIGNDDINNVRKFFSMQIDDAETAENIMKNQMERLNASYYQLAKASQYAGLVKNKIYAPGMPEIETSYNEVWKGVYEREYLDLSFSATSDPFNEFERARSIIQKNAGLGLTSYKMIAIVNTATFNLFLNNPYMAGLYLNQSKADNPLFERVSGDGVGRVFIHQNVTMIEDLSDYIPNDKVYVMPLGIKEMASVHYGPPDAIDYTGERGIQEMYAWQTITHKQISIEAASTFCHLINRPDLIVEYTIKG